MKKSNFNKDISDKSRFSKLFELQKKYAIVRLAKSKQSIFQRIAKILTHRLVFTLILIAMQILFFILIIVSWSRSAACIYVLCHIVSLLAVIYIINKQGHPDYKIAWIIPILAFPIFGGMLYLIYGGNWASRRSIKYNKKSEEYYKLLINESSEEDELFDESTDLDAKRQSLYIKNICHCPAYNNSQARYLSDGKKYFYTLMNEIAKAKKFIFLEYFIINNGVMWDSILELLIKKVSEGVEIRVLYDDIGCMFTLPMNYSEHLSDLGIKCKVYQPFIPVVSTRLNNRDHRKICVIDGNVAITGGLNLSDEYINEWERFGHWKDAGIIVKGEAVWSMTVMFLSLWNSDETELEDISLYKPDVSEPKLSDNGIIQPYTSTPGSESVGANVYMHLITSAKKYVYITTPYLVIDNAMCNALCEAAQSGIDVRIITPHIPDKRYVFELTRAHYDILLDAGVSIYEYEPGFIHAKTFVVDDVYGVVGTVNLDYRSLYLHYECGVWLYNCSAIKAIKNDFISTEKKSIPVKNEINKSLNGLHKLYRAILRIFAPLM